MRSEVTHIPLERWNNRHNWWMAAIGRLKQGVSLPNAEGQIFGINKQQEADERRAVPNDKYINTASKIVLMPGGRGLLVCRKSADAASFRFIRCCRAGLADCLRECRQPDARPRCGAPAGSGGASGRGRQPLPDHCAAFPRKPFLSPWPVVWRVSASRCWGCAYCWVLCRSPGWMPVTINPATDCAYSGSRWPFRW